MPRETEIKLRVEDLSAFLRVLRRLGARRVSPGSGRVHEWNVLFDTPDQQIARRKELLRIRTESTEESGSRRSKRKGERVLLTFKRPVRGNKGTSRVPVLPRRHKVREEIELEIADAAALRRIFEGLGLRGWFCYEKFRTTYGLSRSWAKGLLIELDETPIGTFVELEGPAKAIDRAARELGFQKSDYVVANYLSLYLEACRRSGDQPGNLVFAKRGARKKSRTATKKSLQKPFFS
jgi:adenylate cyclase class 2